MSRLNTIEAKLVFYNANTDNNHSPDCVARSISLAFGTSYNTVKYQLRKFARDRNNGLVWNNVVNFSAWIKQTYGSQYVFQSIKDFCGDDALTVKEFSETYSTGSYLLLVGHVPGRLSHMVAVVDGDIYDSWDSQKQIISRVMPVKSERSDLHEASDDERSRYIDELTKFIDAYLAKVTKRSPYLIVDLDDEWKKIDAQTIIKDIEFRIDYNKIPEEWSRYLFDGEGWTSSRLVIKINPSLSFDDNLKTNKDHIQYVIRESAYKVTSQVNEAKKLDELRGIINPEFSGNREYLSKLPKAYIPRITWLSYNPYSDTKFEGYVVANKDDERSKFHDDEVWIRGDNFREFKDNLSMYIEHNMREGYDY